MQSLKTSLLYYKGNTQARNLLGLVYYEMGEVTEAVVQWVIAHSLDSEDRFSKHMLKKLDEDQAELQRKSQAIQRYNQALNYARNGSEDLAVLRLNKVLELNPRMVNANLLMALLQIHNGQLEKAAKYVHEALRVDRHNPLALRYQKEVRSREARRSAAPEKSYVSKDAEVHHMSGEDVILPSYSETRHGFRMVLLILLGLVLGAALGIFLITPGQVKKVKNDYNEQLRSYSERLSAKEAIIDSSEDEIAQLNDRIEELENSQDYLNLATEYGKLLEVSEYLRDDNYLEAARVFVTVDSSAFSDSVALTMYDSFSTEFTLNGYATLYEAGSAAYESGSYAEAQEYFSGCLSLDAESMEAMYYLGMCYDHLGDTETADSFFNEIIETNPGSTYAEWAQEQMDAR